MKLSSIYSDKNSRLKISFEVFPPKDKNNYKKLYEELSVLKHFKPEFVSLTWGAGGNDNNSTELIKNIIALGLNVMPHFTCVCSSKDFVKEHIKYLEEYNIQNILALRGDIPENRINCCGDFKYANELVRFIKSISDLSIGVAGYPEGHIEANSLDEDIKNLKRKVDSGADAIFTQLFFDNDLYFKYVDKVHKADINVPVIPGIMPILSIKQIEKMTNLARITIPEYLADKLDKYKNSNDDIQKFGIEFGINQCKNLLSEGVTGLHFFTLNKSNSTKEILENL